MINIIWSDSNGGLALEEPHDLGSAASSASPSSTTPITLYIRHDGDNEITNVKLYLTPAVTYEEGIADSQTDLDEVLSWARYSSTHNQFGVQINMDATGSFPTDSWQSLGGTDGGANVEVALPLSVKSGATSTGTIASGDSPNVRVKLRVRIPPVVEEVGQRNIDLKLRYTYST